MEVNGLLQTLPGGIRIFLATFVAVLSVGFFSGLCFVNNTDSGVPGGIERNYLGNEDDMDAEIMIFRKSQREMLTIIHTHILSMSFIFVLLGTLVWMAELPVKLKLFLTIEPFFSLLVTFGGIYLLWQGMLWMKYIVFLSGVLMTATYILSAGLVFYQLLKRP
jgi:hypothetical protein